MFLLFLNPLNGRLSFVSIKYDNNNHDKNLLINTYETRLLKPNRVYVCY